MPFKLKIRIKETQMPKLYTPQEQKPEEYFIKASSGSGGVHLQIVDQDGHNCYCGDILDIRPDGTLFRHSCIDQDTAKLAGIQLDCDGSIKLA